MRDSKIFKRFRRRIHAFTAAPERLPGAGSRYRRADAALLDAVFNVDFHAAVVRARAGDERAAFWYESLLRWLERSPGKRPWKLRDPDDLTSILTRRDLALLGELPPWSRHRRHAAGSLARSAHLLDTMGERALARFLVQKGTEQRLLRQDVGEWLLLDSRGRARREALSADDVYLQAAFAGPSCITNLSTRCWMDEFLVTTAEVRFDSTRPVAQLARRSDPRAWDDAGAETFHEADLIAAPPADPMLPPPLPPEADEEAAYGTSIVPSGLLYEHAVFAYGGLQLMDFRNVLGVRYEVSPKHLESKYWLSEALSVSLNGGSPVAGGLDRDSGVFRATQRGGKTQIFASKSIRLAAPASDREAVNYSFLVSLEFWFCNLVALGVCSDNLEPG